MIRLVILMNFDKIINLKGNGYERKEYSKRGVCRTWNKSSRIIKSVRSQSTHYIRVEQGKNTKNGTNGIRTYDREQKTKRTIRKYKEFLQNTSRNLIKYQYLFRKLNETIDNLLKSEYNTPKQFRKLKGYIMQVLSKSTKTILKDIKLKSSIVFDIQRISNQLGVSQNIFMQTILETEIENYAKLLKMR